MQSELKHTRPKAIRTRRGGVVLVLTAIVIVGLIGMVGMATDLGIAYFLKARLSQAADAAALAGARSLARGKDLASQTASAQSVATAFFNANFPNGYWGCTTSFSPATIWEDPNNSKIRRVQFTASATMPLYFMRALGMNTATLGTSAQAARRDANIMIVLDRSGSMSKAISQLVQSAQWLVGQFSPGRDKVGLVTFGTTYSLIKPTASFTTGSTNVSSAIGTLVGNAAGSTNHAQPLWLAYEALADANEPGALNVIVFFTDGEPNTITADFSGSYRKSPTTCDASNSPMIGNAMGDSASAFFGTSAIPPYQPNSISPGTVRSAYLSGVYYDKSETSTSRLISQYSTNYSGCQFAKSGGYNCSGSYCWTNDITQIPTTDYYGNSTKPANAYKSVTLTDLTRTKSGTNSYSMQTLISAAFNAGDNAAFRMRNGPGQLGTPTHIIPLIDCISLDTTSGAIDATYMKRIANTTDSPIYAPTMPAGLYVHAVKTADLQGAFVQIAAQILHLSQ